MEIIRTQNYNPKFGNSLGFAFTNFIEERVLLNKALVDASVDVPMVAMANNKTERKERFNRASIAWVMAFVSPVVMLPLVNRLALKYISKTSPKIFSKEFSIVIESVLGKLFDKCPKTNILDKDCKKTLLNKIIPPIKQVKDLEGRSRKIVNYVLHPILTLYYVLVKLIITNVR